MAAIAWPLEIRLALITILIPVSFNAMPAAYVNNHDQWFQVGQVLRMASCFEHPRFSIGRQMGETSGANEIVYYILYGACLDSDSRQLAHLSESTFLVFSMMI